MKFIVDIGNHKFLFDDADCAIVFAGTAKKNYIKRKNDDDIEVTITIEKEEKENGMEF